MVDYIDLKEMLPSMRETLEGGGNVNLTVAGNSMLPMLAHNKDRVTLVKPETIKKYDVTLFVREDGSPVLHRVVKIKNGEFIIRGDNCGYSETVSPSQILAVVTSFTHNGKECHVVKNSYKMYSFLWCNELCFFIRKRLLPKAKSVIKKILKK